MVAVEGLTHIVSYLNPAFALLTAKEAGDLIGCPFAEAVPEGPSNHCLALLDRVIRTGTYETLLEQEHRLTTSEHRNAPVYWSYSAWAILGADSRPAGVMVQVTDATETAIFRRRAAAMNESLMLSSVQQHEFAEAAETSRAHLRHEHDLLEERVTIRTAELRQVQERALQAERMAAIGQTLAALAHEGRNALQRAYACVSRLSWRLENRPEELDLAERARHALGDLEHLFDDVRGYAAPVRLNKSACDLRQVWREAWGHSIEQQSGRDAQVTEEVETEDLVIDADSFRLSQVFRNLFGNALEACTDPVRITVSCREAVLSGQAALSVSVCDNGPGFAPELRTRAFEPFITTKSKGTGLGLAITKRIVEAHGGLISLSERGKSAGTEVILIMPRQNA